VKSILLILNAGKPENYRFKMDYITKKKKEIHELKCIALRIYVLSIRLHEILFVCEYQLWCKILCFFYLAHFSIQEKANKVRLTQFVSANPLSAGRRILFALFHTVGPFRYFKLARYDHINVVSGKEILKNNIEL
jgi:hypothetical protein